MRAAAQLASALHGCCPRCVSPFHSSRHLATHPPFICALPASTPTASPHASPFAVLLQVSIVQPVSGVGLVGLAVYSHLFLKEKMHALEWGAVALAFVGTIGLGATGSDGDAAGSGGAADAAAAAAGADGAGGTAAAAAVKAAGAARQVVQPGAFRMLGVVLLLSAGVLLVSLLRQRHHHRQRRPGDRTTAATYGLQAGACFGLSAASCRIGGCGLACCVRSWGKPSRYVGACTWSCPPIWATMHTTSPLICSIRTTMPPCCPCPLPRAGFLLAQRLSKLWVAVGLGGSVTLSSSGFVLQTCGFKEGSAGELAALLAGWLAGLEWGRPPWRLAAAGAGRPEGKQGLARPGHLPAQPHRVAHRCTSPAHTRPWTSAGAAVIVCTLAAVSSMVTGGAWGGAPPRLPALPLHRCRLRALAPAATPAATPAGPEHLPQAGLPNISPPPPHMQYAICSAGGRAGPGRGAATDGRGGGDTCAQLGMRPAGRDG